MEYKVTFASDAGRDFELIFEFLFESYVAFGEAPGPAADHAEARVQAIRARIEGLAKTPQIGALHDDILPGLRHVTLDRAIVWFDLEGGNVRVLAIFFGSQDHVRHMLARLLG